MGLCLSTLSGCCWPQSYVFSPGRHVAAYFLFGTRAWASLEEENGMCWSNVFKEARYLCKYWGLVCSGNLSQVCWSSGSHLLPELNSPVSENMMGAQHCPRRITYFSQSTYHHCDVQCAEQETCSRGCGPPTEGLEALPSLHLHPWWEPSSLESTVLCCGRSCVHVWPWRACVVITIVVLLRHQFQLGSVSSIASTCSQHV